MKSSDLNTFVALILFLAPTLSAQETCKVLLPSISGTYAGDCRQGLAHGLGEATGIDFYKGEFLKGLPDGKGSYLWKNGATYSGEWKKGMRDGNGVYISKEGGRDSTLAGIWREDQYIGEVKKPPYVIEYRNGVGRVTCMRIGDRPYVRFKFSRSGGESNNLSNVLMQGTSGTESNTSAFTGYEQVKFPFSGKVSFNAPNAFNAAILTCEVRLVINEPGAWLVTISY